MTAKSKKVKIVEVGLRDGLQNESQIVSTETKIQLAQKFVSAGVKNFEIGAFVSKEWVPQMSDTSAVLKGFQKKNHKKIQGTYSVLVPNAFGMQLAVDHRVPEVAIFASSSESFSIKNINASIDESFKRFETVIPLAKKNKIKIRGYLSVCFGCPFEGAVSEAQVVKLARKLHQMGCYEISIGDTIGVAHPGQVQSLFKKLLKYIPAQHLAGHFHDTRGLALVNILQAYEMGIRVFDSSLGGLGGCPYAPGATGNVATEDVVYMFEGMNIGTGIDLEKLLSVNQWMAQQMGRPLPSKMGRVGFLKPRGVIRKK